MTTSTLRQGEAIDLDTRIGGGPIVRRDTYCEDVYAIEKSRGELSVEEIERLAVLTGVIDRQEEHR